MNNIKLNKLLSYAKLSELTYNNNLNINLLNSKIDEYNFIDIAIYSQLIDIELYIFKTSNEYIFSIRGSDSYIDTLNNLNYSLIKMNSINNNINIDSNNDNIELQNNNINLNNNINIDLNDNNIELQNNNINLNNNKIDIKNINDNNKIDYKNINDNIKIHYGFYKYISYLINIINIYIKEAKSKNIKNITFIGHSAGSICIILASLIGFNDINSDLLISNYTFGAPKIGNNNFNKFCDRYIDININCINKYDPVPLFPLFNNYKNVHNIYYINNNKIRYILFSPLTILKLLSRYLICNFTFGKDHQIKNYISNIKKIITKNNNI